jgi:hypothetical protein
MKYTWGQNGEDFVDNFKMTPDNAQVLALQALEWILGPGDLVSDFITNTGAYPQDLASLAAQPLFLGAVLDFVMEQDDRVIRFCQDHGHPLTIVQSARAVLPGAQHLHWT